MEINLVTSSNIPDGSIFSIRAGAVRKEAPLTSKGPFCFAAGPMDSALKVEVYKPVASEHVVMKPGENQYNVMFTGPADGPQMSCEIHVKPLGEGTAVTAPPAIEQMEPAGEEGSACTRKAKEHMQSHLASKAGAVEAKEYLESHQVLEFIQALLQTIVKERPADPYSFLSRHFTSGYHPHGVHPQDEPAWLERLLAAAGLPGLLGQAKEWLAENGCRGTEEIRSGYPISSLVDYLIEHSMLKSIPASRLWKAAKSVQEEEEQHAWLRRFLAAAELPELFGQAAKWVAETGYDIKAGDCVSNLIDHLTKHLKYYPARRLYQAADMLEGPPCDQQDLVWLGSLLAAVELPELFGQSAAKWVMMTGCEQSDLRDGDGVEELVELLMLMEFQESRLRMAAKSLQRDEFPWLRHLLGVAKLPQHYDQAAKWVAMTGCKEYDIRGGGSAEGLIDHLKLKKFPAKRLWKAAQELRKDKLAWLRRLLAAAELPQHFDQAAKWVEENYFHECDVDGGDSVKDLIEHLRLKKFPASRLQKAAMQAATQAAKIREDEQLARLRRLLAAAELPQHFNQAAECMKEIGCEEDVDVTLIIEELVERLGLEKLLASRLEKAAKSLEKEDELPWLRSLLTAAELPQHFDQAAEWASEWVFQNGDNSVHGRAESFIEELIKHSMLESFIEELIKHLMLEKIPASRLEKAAESLRELAWLRRLLAAAELPEPEWREHFDVAAEWVAETGCEEYDFRGGVITEALIEELIERLDLEKIPASRLAKAAASMRVRLSLNQDNEEQHNQVAEQCSAVPQHTDGAKAVALPAPEEGAASEAAAAAEEAAERRRRDAQIVEKRLLTPLQLQAAETAAAAVCEEAARLEEVPQKDRISTDGTTMWDSMGGARIDRLLRHTPLIEIGWLIALTEAGGVVPRNQDVPPEALITPRNAWRLRMRKWRHFHLPVLVLSYPWLDWWHPDRLGAQLRRLLPVFKAFLKAARDCSEHGTVGVLMDFPCLPQKPFASEEETARFRASLGAINEWYFHPHTFVLLVTPSPPAADAQGYSNTRLHRGRGWCFFELAASMTAKNGGCLLDFGSYGDEGDLDGCISSMKRGRLPPISPPKFEEELRRRVQLEEREPDAADGLKFTAKADMELVIEQYRKGFVSTFEHLDKSRSCEHSASEVDWTGLGWGDEEGHVMLETCRYILKHCKLPGPIKLRCERGNHFSQAMLKQLPHESSLSDMPEEFNGTFLRMKGDNADLLGYWMSR